MGQCGGGECLLNMFMEILLLGIAYSLVDWLVKGVVLEIFICFCLGAEYIKVIRKIVLTSLRHR